jgi:hypothetical protein
MSTTDGASDAAGSVDDIPITGELARRSSRSPDHEAESPALAALAREMAANPGGVLHKLLELVEGTLAPHLGASGPPRSKTAYAPDGTAGSPLWAVPRVGKPFASARLVRAVARLWPVTG